jgi:hypothetical protein
VAAIVNPTKTAIKFLDLFFLLIFLFTSLFVVLIGSYLYKLNLFCVGWWREGKLIFGYFGSQIPIINNS